MSSSSSDTNDNAASLIKTPSSKRTRVLGSQLHASETKRRRSSFSHTLVLCDELTRGSKASRVKRDICDRFIPTLLTAAPFYPIQMTNPRTIRLARALACVDRKLLSFHDGPPISHWSSDPTLLYRLRLSRSLIEGKKIPTDTCSAAKHGRKKPDKMLDSGPMASCPIHPCAWSSADIVGAVLRGQVYVLSMNTNKVSKILDYGHARSLAWTSGIELAVGHALGCTVLIDSGTTKVKRYYLYPTCQHHPVEGNSKNDVMAISWSNDRGLLAVGRVSGVVSYYDPRAAYSVRTDYDDSARAILGIQWSPDGLHLASASDSGAVRCTDARMNKSFDLKLPQRKTAHKSAVKSLAWAPWNPRLLATGGNAYDHTVHIWSISKLNPGSPEPTHSLSLSSNISSLHFSPHTTEIFSTHGEAALDLPLPHLVPQIRRRRSTATANTSSTSPTHHALLVHSYPSLQRVFSVPRAHSKPIVDSVLSPDGTRVLTFGKDETIRFWTVWGARKPDKPRGTSWMDQCMIR